MKMACLGGHFPVRIREDTRETMRDASHFCGIQMAFLFEPKTILVEMTMVDDLLANRNLMISLKLQKKNWTKTRMGNNFLVTGQGVY